MNKSTENLTSRREFIKSTGRIAAASALAGMAIPHVHAAPSETVQVALIGCGGRGTGAAKNALSTQSGPIKLVAMADVFESRLNSSYAALDNELSDKIDVPEGRKFIGFEGYKQAMDCLRPGDVAIFTAPPAFRWPHFSYAIEKKLNVFMEKPVTVDGPSSRRMLQLAAESEKKNLKVGVGLMVRHCDGRKALKERIDDGAIGDIIAMRAYRMHGPVAFAFSTPKPDNISHMMYQVQRFHSFLWASGGLYSDFYIHQIDECCWMKGAWPVRAHGNGGRHYRGEFIDQNFDNYTVEYTFADGTSFFFYGRTMIGCKDEFSSIVHGAKGMATVSYGSHHLGRAGRIYKGHNIVRRDETWAYPGPQPEPYQLEWDHLIDAIRNDKPFNEVRRGVEASLVTSMGRMAAHTGQTVEYDDILNSDHEFAPDVDKLTKDSPPPLAPEPDGTYAVPMPGIKKEREY